MEKETVERLNPLYVQSQMKPIEIKYVVQLIEQHSIESIYEQSYKCPCVDPQTLQPKPDCPICHGQGFIFMHPKSLDIAFLSDQKQFSLNTQGLDQNGATLATPQITVNQIEQGIKPGDRITVPGWTTNENYIFNVDQQRLNNGIYLPYKVQSINEAYTISGGSLSRLQEGDLTLDGDFLKVTNDQLLNSTISLSLEVVKRFYVVSLEKELRYQKYLNLAQKLWALGNGTGEINSNKTDEYTTLNSYLSNKQAMQMDKIKYPQVQNRDGKLIDTSKKQIYRMPPQLRLKRENLYFSNINLTNKESNGNTAINDPRVTEMNDFLGD